MQRYWSRNRVFILLTVALVLINAWYFLVGYSDVFAGYFHMDILLSHSRIIFYVSSAIVALVVALFDAYMRIHSAKLTTVALAGILIGTLLLIYSTSPEVGSPGSLLTMSYLLIGAAYTWIIITIYQLLSSFVNLYRILFTSVISFFFTPILYTALFQYLPEKHLLIWAPLFALAAICLVMAAARVVSGEMGGAVAVAEEERSTNQQAGQPSGWSTGQPTGQPTSQPAGQQAGQPTGKPMAFVMRYRNQLAQIATIAIVLVAMRSIRIGGLWGAPATTPDNLFLVIIISQVGYLALAIPVLILYIRQSSMKSSLFPFLVLIFLLLIMSHMEAIQDAGDVAFGLDAIVERLSQSLFPLILIVCSRKLPVSFFRVCGLAISIENIIAIFSIAFLEDIQMNKISVTLFMVFVIVVLIVFMKTEDTGGDDNDDRATARIDDILAKRSCELGEKGGLTAREEEVLLFLAQGRSIPHISRRLQVAEGTVRTHVKHIYQKLDIHSKQELLDRFADDEEDSVAPAPR
jgi:DNA-binding CsgD family transcriptional regulator